MRLLEELDEIAIDLEPRASSLSIPRPKRLPYALRTPFGGKTLPCATLADAINATRRRTGVNYVKIEVWRTHYRLRNEDGTCIGVLRFSGKDPISWTYPPKTASKLPRERKGYKPWQVHGVQHYTCAGCGAEFDASCSGRKPGHRVYHDRACRKRTLQREYNARRVAARAAQ